MTNKNFLRGLALIGLTTAALAQAQIRIETSGVGANQIPIAIAGFTDEAIAPQQVTAIIKADLARSGYFKIIDTGNVMSETTPINYGEWKSRGAASRMSGLQTSASIATGVSFCQRMPIHRNKNSAACIAAASASALQRPGSSGTT